MPSPRYLSVGGGESPPRYGASAIDNTFDSFYELHARTVFGYLWRMTGSEQTAHDLTQETFVRAWNHFAKVQTYERPRSWLFRVATHLVINHTQQLRRQPPLLNEEHERLLQVDDQTAGIAEQDAVLRILLRLRSRERAALVLHAVLGFTCSEIARALGISDANAKVTLWRAREHFRAYYGREEGES